MYKVPGTHFRHIFPFRLTAGLLQIQVLMDIDMKTVKLQATVKHLHDELSSYITKLTEVQASTIKIGWYIC